MVAIGKLNMTELAYSGIGLNPHYGTPLNPNDRATPRAPGGSSSGCGVAVAARLVPCAVGSDTGGSVRIPAAFNGVVGYKTSHGRIDATGLVPLARSYDTIGPLARSVEDCILLDMAMRGMVTTPIRRSDLRSLSVVAPRNVVFNDAQPAVVENFERTLDVLAEAGVSVRRETVGVLDEILEMNATYGTLTAAEAYNEYREIVDSDKVGMIDRRVVKRIMDGKKMAANDVLSIQRGRARLIPKLNAQLGGALLVMPTTPITAPRWHRWKPMMRCSTRPTCWRCATPRSATSSIFAPWRCRTAATAAACRPASCFRRRGAQMTRCSDMHWSWSASSARPARRWRRQGTEDGMSADKRAPLRKIRTRAEDAPRRARRRLCRPLAGAGGRLQLAAAATRHRMVLGRNLEPARA